MSHWTETYHRIEIVLGNERGRDSVAGGESRLILEGCLLSGPL
jgi:hypothetical protein